MHRWYVRRFACTSDLSCNLQHPFLISTSHHNVHRWGLVIAGQHPHNLLAKARCAPLQRSVHRPYTLEVVSIQHNICNPVTKNAFSHFIYALSCFNSKQHTQVWTLCNQLVVRRVGESHKYDTVQFFRSLRFVLFRSRERVLCWGAF
jgi:hypothetical protein